MRPNLYRVIADKPEGIILSDVANFIMKTWKAGDSCLFSVSQISDMTGKKRSPIQRAVRRLRKLGAIQCWNRRAGQYEN